MPIFGKFICRIRGKHSMYMYDYRKLSHSNWKCSTCGVEEYRWLTSDDGVTYDVHIRWE